MSSEGSLTPWIERLKEGDPAAAQALWERCYPQLVRFAREKLEGSPRGMADEEDVALSALKSFCGAAQRGRFPDLADHHGLWRLLLRITERKAANLARHEKRQRRGGGRVRGGSALGNEGSAAADQGFAGVADDAPSPQFAAIMAEEYRRLLGLLHDADRPHLQAIALAKMEGCTNREIAQQLDCSERTIERGLELIRKKWEKEQPP